MCSFFWFRHVAMTGVTSAYVVIIGTKRFLVKKIMNRTVSIGDRLKEERLRLGMTQPVMGETGGVTKKSQMLYESGERFPDARYLAAIEAIGADVIYVLTGQRSNAAMSQHLTPKEQIVLDAYRSGTIEQQDFILKAALGFAGTGESLARPQPGASAVRQKVKDNHGVMIVSGRDVMADKKSQGNKK